MAALQALIFDVDGTLADTEECHRRAFNKTFVAHGLGWRWSRDDYARLLEVTGGKERIAHYLRDWLGENPERLDIPALHQEKTANYVAMLEAGEIVLRPGVKRLLEDALYHGLRLAIATTTSMANVTTLIEKNLGREMLEAFAVIAAGDCVTAKKPAPDIYLYALDAMKIEPAAALAFEDSAAGVQSARRARLTTIVTANPYTEGQDFSGAFSVLTDLGEPDAPARRLAGAVPDDGFVSVPWLNEALV